MPFSNELIVFALAVPLGLGIGGGGIFLVYLIDVLGIPRNSAVYLNLIFFLSALLCSAVAHLRARRLSFSFLGSILLFGIPGAFLGRALAAFLPVTLLHVLLGIFLLASGIFSLITAKKAKDTSDSLDK